MLRVAALKLWHQAPSKVTKMQKNKGNDTSPTDPMSYHKVRWPSYVIKTGLEAPWSWASHKWTMRCYGNGQAGPVWSVYSWRATSLPRIIVHGNTFGCFNWGGPKRCWILLLHNMVLVSVPQKKQAGLLWILVLMEEILHQLGCIYIYNNYPVNNGIFTIISTGAEFLPSTVRIQAFFIWMNPSN